MSYSTDLISLQLYYCFIVIAVILLGHIQQKFAALCFKRSLPLVHYSYSLLQSIKIVRLIKRRYHLDALFLFKYRFVPNSARRVLETAVFEFLFGMSETFLCSASAVKENIVILLVAPKLLFLFVGTLSLIMF
jgi:hypothetical protein